MTEQNRFGGYVLLDRLGAGGMGEVWRARHEMLGRLAAIKLVQPHTVGSTSKDDALRRFEREARATSALDSPHTIQLYDFGVTPDGRFYYAMELLQGLDLQELVERFGPAPPERASHLLQQVCASLGEAHHRGLVHRDVKPSNAYLCRLGLEYDFVKVLDFGLVKASARDYSQLTGDGVVGGTPAFLAPETVGGNVDSRADIYGVGCLLYWLLTGQRVFDGATPMEVVLHHVNSDPAPPSSRIDTRIPKELDTLVLRCLQKEPEERPQSMSEIQEALQNLHFASPWTQGRAEDWWQEHELDLELGAERDTDATSPTHDIALDENQETAALEETGRDHSKDGHDLAIGTRPGNEAVSQSRQRAWARKLALLGLALTITVAGVWFFYHRKAIRWATETAIPEIEALVEIGRFQDAVALAEEAERFIADDPRWTDLWPRMASHRSLTTNAPADVYLDPIVPPAYVGQKVEPSEGWKHAGTTPLEVERLPLGAYRVRIEADGHETIEGVYHCNPVASGEHVQETLSLIPKGTVPPGMVVVQAQNLSNPAIGFANFDPVPSRPQDPTYFLGRHEVTNAEYKRFVDAGGYDDLRYWQAALATAADSVDGPALIATFRDQSHRPGPATWDGGTFPEGKETHPVTGVSWFEAAAYANFAGAELPTVYHWFGGRDSRLDWEVIASSNFGSHGTLPIGTTPFSQYGLYDLAGNVREWVWNSCGEQRFILGGAWNDPSYTFVNGDVESPFNRSNRNGIRLAAYPGQTDEMMAPFRSPTAPRTSNFVWGKSVSDDVFEALRAEHDYDPLPLDEQVEARDESSRLWIRERVSISTPGGDRLPIDVFIPRNVSPPLQTIVYFPGAGSIAPVSSERLQGMRFLEPLIKSGRAVAYPIYSGTYERFDGTEGNPRTASRAHADRKIQFLREVRRTVDYLEARGQTDMNRLAYLGLSWGAEHGAIVLALEKRFRTGVLMDGGAILTPVLPVVDESNFAPRVDVPVLMINGANDYIFPLESSQIPYFQSLGVPASQKRHSVYETGHVAFNAFPEEVVDEIRNWLDEQFGTTP